MSSTRANACSTQSDSSGGRSAATILSASVGRARSSGLNRSSWTFSPGRGPMISIAMSTSGSWPDSLIMLRARSMIFTGSPISGRYNSPRLAHVEHEDLAAAAEAAGADDQLHRLRDRHEVARHARVGDGHGAPGSDLTPEDRHHRARRTEHVAEADGGERGPGVAPLKALDGPLGHRLRCAHDRRGPHGLV